MGDAGSNPTLSKSFPVALGSVNLGQVRSQGSCGEDKTGQESMHHAEHLGGKLRLKCTWFKQAKKWKLWQDLRRMCARIWKEKKRGKHATGPKKCHRPKQQSGCQPKYRSWWLLFAIINLKLSQRTGSVEEMLKRKDQERAVSRKSFIWSKARASWEITRGNSLVK